MKRISRFILFSLFIAIVGIIAFGINEANAQFKPAEQQYLTKENLAVNGGFEQGKRNWTNGAGTFSIDGSNYVLGKKSGKIVLTAQTLDFSQILSTGYNTQLAGLQGIVGAYVKSDVPVQMCALVDGAEVGCANVKVGTNWDWVNYPAVLGDTSIGLKLKTTSNQTGTVYIDGASYGHGEMVQDIAQSEFVFDVNIGGANIPLNVAYSNYTGVVNVGLDLVINKGSNITIPCSGTNASTGLTCSSGSEGVGVVFDAEVGTYEICTSFSAYQGPAVGGAFTAFQMIETVNDAQTILQEGGSRLVIGGSNTSSNDGYSVQRNCGTFDFTSAGRKTIRLMHEKSNTAQLRVEGDRNSSLGQKDIHITGRYYPPSSTIVRAKSLSPDMAGFLSWSFFDMDESQGWLKSDGRCVLKTQYPDYFQNVGTSYGECTVTTLNDGMNLPDMRGYFARALDDMGTTAGAAGVDVDGTARTVGQTQTDQLASHRHRLGGGAGLVGGGQHGYGASNNTSFSSNVYTYYTGGTETRPKNMGLITYVRMTNQDIVIGEFEQIKSNTSPHVYAAGNNGAVISANTPINFTEVEDFSGLWTSNTTFSPPEDAYYDVSGSTSATSSHTGTFYIHDGTANIHYLAPNNLSSTIKPFQGVVYLESSKTYTFRSTSTFTSNNTTVAHRIYIQKHLTEEALVKNLNKNSNTKFQTKILQTSSGGGSNNLTDIEFSNLDITKYYRLSGQVQVSTRSGNDCVAFFRSATNGGGIVYGKSLIRDQSTPASINTTGVNFIFKPVTTGLFVRENCTAPDYVAGNGGRDATFLTLEELPDSYIETTEF